MICNQKSDIQTILQLSDAEWKEVENQASKSGELLYLKGVENEPTFDAFCLHYPKFVLCQFHCLLRPFKNEEKSDIGGLRKFYCIQARK